MLTTPCPIGFYILVIIASNCSVTGILSTVKPSLRRIHGKMRELRKQGRSLLDNLNTEISFANLGISPEIVAALATKDIQYCTRVQEEAIPAMLAGRDVIAEAPTGTGKTFAFGIPMIEKINPDKQATQGLVLAPTRELVRQIEEDIVLLTSRMPEISSLAIYGGARMHEQVQELRSKPHLIIATPGRLIDHLKRRNISLEEVSFVVLDEADRMLDMGFIDDVKFILKQVESGAQMGLFTATLSREVMDISWLYQKQAVEVKVAAVAEDKPDIHELYVLANGAERIEAITDLCKKFGSRKGLVFVNMKQSADITAAKLQDQGFHAASLQGDLPQSKRNRVMQDFHSGKLDMLVATDVAARGLDVDDVDIVFNYDLPLDLENYTHRIGRTGRAGKRGIAVSFVAPGEDAAFDKFCRSLRIKPEQQAWERPQSETQFISKELEEKVAARIRAQSSYLKEVSVEERYNPHRTGRVNRTRRSKAPSHSKGMKRPKQAHSKTREGKVNSKKKQAKPRTQEPANKPETSAAGPKAVTKPKTRDF